MTKRYGCPSSSDAINNWSMAKKDCGIMSNAFFPHPMWKNIKIYKKRRSVRGSNPQSSDMTWVEVRRLATEGIVSGVSYASKRIIAYLGQRTVVASLLARI